MLVPATANGSPDVNGKEWIVTTPELKAMNFAPETTRNNWRDIVQSGADCTQIEGVALEHLIDFQRDRSRFAGNER